MTRKSFYRSLRRIANRFYWNIDKHGAIRARVRKTDSYTYCPLESRVYSLIGEDRYTVNGEISSTDIDKIIYAADTKISDMEDVADERCRKALFRAVGLKEGL